MRTTTRSIGELYDKLLISGKKSSEVKREVLRNQIVTPQNRPTSPLHSYKFESDRHSDEATRPTYTNDLCDERVSGDNNNHSNNKNAIEDSGHVRKGECC
jgi:hypothetical protein